MLHILRWWLLLCFGIVGGLAVAQPTVLIVQLRVSTQEADPRDVPLFHDIAAAIEHEGRVAAIAWTISDPKFRAAWEAGRISPPEQPTLDAARDIARRLNCEYLLVFTAAREGIAVACEASLYRGSGRRPIWTDKQSMSVYVGNAPDTASLGASVGRTWSTMLAQGPWRAYPSRMAEPEVVTGLRPVEPTVVLPVEPTLTSFFDRATELVSRGQGDAAVFVLRDAVDAAPYSAEARMRLIQLLIDLGQPALAAEEAARAAGLVADAGPLRVLAAEAALAAGQHEQARILIQETIARDPADAKAHRLSGFLALLNHDGENAGIALETSIRLADDPATRALLTLAAVQEGDRARAGAFVEGAALDPVWRDRLRPVLDRISQFLVDDLRSFFQRARIRPELDATRAEWLRLSGTTEGLDLFLTTTQWPANDRERHERFLLGVKMTALVLADLERFITTGDEQALTDASLTFGDAIQGLRFPFRSEGQ